MVQVGEHRLILRPFFVEAFTRLNRRARPSTRFPRPQPRFFPRSRDNLSKGRRRQLRDALILGAHIREGRDIFVTNDERAFIRDGRREKLHALFGVHILTHMQFLNACGLGAL